MVMNRDGEVNASGPLSPRPVFTLSRVQVTALEESKYVSDCTRGPRQRLAGTTSSLCSSKQQHAHYSQVNVGAVKP